MRSRRRRGRCRSAWVRDGKGRTARYNVRVATSEDLPRIAALDAGEFHASSVELDGLQRWFDVYPRGAFVLEDRVSQQGATIIGAFGFWPITSTAFMKIVEGKIDEREITASDIR